MSFQILGHRGMGPTSTLKEMALDRLAENTIEAFSCALELGADGLEFDVHMTADGRVAVIHDNKLNEKVAGANRTGTELGNVDQFNLAAIQGYDMGNGGRVPSLEETLDLFVERNAAYKAEHGRNLTINIEFKGEGTVQPVVDIISDYIADGRLAEEDFIFNSFEWDKLRELKAINPNFKVMPAIKTKELFGEGNMGRPGDKYFVDPDLSYDPVGLQKLADFHAEIGVHAFDCIIFDLRPEMVDFCEAQGVGLFTSTSYNVVDADKIEDPMRIMVDARDRLNYTGFRADDVTETRGLIAEIEAERDLDGMQNDAEQGIALAETGEPLQLIIEEDAPLIQEAPNSPQNKTEGSVESGSSDDETMGLPNFIQSNGPF